MNRIISIAENLASAISMSEFWALRFVRLLFRMAISLPRRITVLSGIFVTLLGSIPTMASEVVVAVAANFVTTARVLVEDFQADGKHRVILVHGSTGKIYAQIVSGAPFDVFLAADRLRPELLDHAGLAAKRTAYAFGKLTFLAGEGGQGNVATLETRYPRIAVADPETAPYGVAAKEVLVALRGEENWARNVVFGDSVGQAFNFVASGNVNAGFVAKSQIAAHPFDGSDYVVPEHLYSPIRQEAVLLDQAISNPAAINFYTYLSSPRARVIIRASGYGLPD